MNLKLAMNMLIKCESNQANDFITHIHMWANNVTRGVLGQVKQVLAGLQRIGGMLSRACCLTEGGMV